MQQSFLICGRQPSISLAEVLGAHPGIAVDAFGTAVLVVGHDSLGETAPRDFGSIPKSGVHLGILEKFSEHEIADILESKISGARKFNFGVSAYAYADSVAPAADVVKRIGIATKRLLKQRGHSVRFVESRSGNLSTVDVAKNRLLEDGVEVCVFATPDGFEYGITQAVQPFAEYAERDHARPGRDARRGMLPPKLARTMVNLASLQGEGIVLDPFCGVGTVLQEASLLGYQTIGTDIDEGAVDATIKNLNWLREQNPELSSQRIEALDVRSINTRLEKESVDAVVSELDLGPPLSGAEPLSRIMSIERELSGLYSEAFGVLHDVLKTGGRAVVAWPYFYRYQVFISAFDLLSGMGWKVIRPYERTYDHVFPLSGRGTLLYGRDDQQVFREIILLEKT